MQFKRWRLSKTRPFVNASLVLAVSFTLLACGNTEKSPSDAGDTVTKDGRAVELPAVWETRKLEGAVADMAISDGLSGLLAIAYENGGLQLFNMESEPVGEMAPFGIKALANGYATILDDTQLTVFPAVFRDGTIRGFVYNPGLASPVSIEFPIDEDSPVAGVCSAGSDSGFARIGYWTEADDKTLITGAVDETDGDFSWTAGDTVTADDAITSCAFSEASATVFTDLVSTAPFLRNGREGVVQLNGDGVLTLKTVDTLYSPITVRSGITVTAPDRIEAVTAIGAPLRGGYPGGVIIIAGPMPNGDTKAVFVDASPITLADE